MGRPRSSSGVEEQGQAGSEHRVAEDTSKVALVGDNSHVLGVGRLRCACGTRTAQAKSEDGDLLCVQFGLLSAACPGPVSLNSSLPV